MNCLKFIDLNNSDSETIIGKVNRKLNMRERFQGVMHFKNVDRIPNFEIGYWNETLPEWHNQGLPSYVKDKDSADVYFRLEPLVLSPVKYGILPLFEYKVLEENEEYNIVIDELGAKCEINKNGHSSIPHYIEFPIKDRNSWKEFRKRLDANNQSRFPENWDNLVEEYRNRDYPLGICCGSLLGRLRDYMGFENISLAFHDMPDLVHEMINYVTEYYMNLMEKQLKDVQFDFAFGYEDIAFKNGPMISPAMFREFLYPNYKKIGDLLHKYGVDIIYPDCDGNINLIVEQWLEAGYNCMFPIEVNAGTDPVELRMRYGKRIKLIGGVNKMNLRCTKADIMTEMKRLEPLINQGGYIPHIDHLCPPDIPYENYLYYLEIKRKILGF